MTLLQTLTGTPIGGPAVTDGNQAKSVYDALLQPSEKLQQVDAVAFLHRELARAKHASCEVPIRPEQLEAWIGQGVANVAEQYSAYLQERHAGGPRRYFTGRSHALYFLQHVAPTKLVDGAWLYGLLPHWADYRFHGLIRTYLEELGDGEPALNHVCLYKKLIADLDCDPGDTLADVYYLQGAIQLALGQHGAAFLPEVIGYNLGYEQLPLHLLITSFELNELGIDPHYFTLHVTIDNASTGHARKAAQSVLSLMPMGAERDEFYRRVVQGYKLNELGIGSTAVIKSFDLEQEVITMLERKRTFGQHMHSDYCRLEGLTINEWLAQPDQIPAFLDALLKKGWIKRDEDPANSRFWKLIDGAGAPMFGVFSGYEKQLLWDWIAGERIVEESAANAFRFQFRSKTSGAVGLPDSIVQTDPDLQGLISDLERCAAAEKMSLLKDFMCPAMHATPAGLFATREFVKLMSEGQPA
ncbi:iron-containing redox enzyme family protein [Pseudomonas frederiksbergensis]|uniref:Iron-containing redox enzyme family protein n=1 Tax=Pseudomonas frederiksbergensis TaxID=104087 RepID=A0A423KR44_9PSED|nr:iron-containing redox enzyme family protein [Pseudomonas frederiksbergensis]RON57829.1 hypothetical protein BK665_02955 [Pseudomonas frederiksbergensis]